MTLPPIDLRRGDCQELEAFLWVAEEHRGNDVGSALLRAAETNAKDRGCTIAFVSSHSFQSPGFYTHLGYAQQATLRDHPVGYSSVFLAKRLAPVAD